MTPERLAGRALGPSRRIFLALVLAIPLAPLSIAPASAQAFDPARADIAAFIAELSQKHGFEPAPLTALFAEAESRPFILQAIAKPAERTLTWDEYRAKFLIERRIDRGVEVHGQRRSDRHHPRHRRRGDVLRREHRQAPRARRARHARLRLPAAAEILPQ